MLRPKLEYCSNVLHASLQLCSCGQLEKCQNRALRVICNTRGDFSATAARQLLEVSTLVSRRDCRFRSFVRCVAKRQCSPYLVEILESCPKRSVNMTLRGDCEYVVPTVTNEYGKRSFLYRCINALKNPDLGSHSFEL